jgi:hypothetical protein
VVFDREVQYSNLRPRPYRFRVVAANNSGVWNEQGDALEFSVLPAYYRTNWFRALGAAAFMTLLCAAYRYRIRRLQHDFEMTLEARIGERTRIARDLHDTLLQSLHGLLLRFQTVSVLFPERPMEAKEKLDRCDRASCRRDHGRAGCGAGNCAPPQSSATGSIQPWSRGTLCLVRDERTSHTHPR